MEVIREFDPWNDPLCTCPKKFGLNPYTGCCYQCVYCYITSYIPRAFECRPKENLLSRMKRDLKRIDHSHVISMSNSSDPYPPIESNFKLTRSCLEVFLRERFPVQIMTKSDLVVRDIDLLSKMRCTVSFTVTTLDKKLSSMLEPNAPPPDRRLKAMKKLSDAGIPVTSRLDPIIPGLNDSEIEQVVDAMAAHGAAHVTSSTFKPRADSWNRVKNVFPEVASKLHHLYFVEGKLHHNSWYLPKTFRITLLSRVKKACDKNSITFASCREGLKWLTTGASCDGTHLIPKTFE
ncbi:MAG: radical SAM protein [Hadesarchaea archaeon]|nr:MAG: radical SAM protein [Hadesarchaea archaeon]